MAALRISSSEFFQTPPFKKTRTMLLACLLARLIDCFEFYLITKLCVTHFVASCRFHGRARYCNLSKMPAKVRRELIVCGLSPWWTVQSTEYHKSRVFGPGGRSGRRTCQIWVARWPVGLVHYAPTMAAGERHALVCLSTSIPTMDFIKK